MISLASRPVLFTLARALAEAWPDDIPRDALIARAFRLKHADETHRARLRVEIGRLRTLLRPLADVCATARGFALVPHRASNDLSQARVVVLARPVEEKHRGRARAALADGEAWSSSSLALALGASQLHAVQRALDALAAVGKVQVFGRGRGAALADAAAARIQRRRCYSARRRCRLIRMAA